MESPDPGTRDLITQCWTRSLFAVRTVTSICFAAIAGVCVAFLLLALFVAPVGPGIPIVAGLIATGLVFGALAMARQAGTPGCLPVGVLLLASTVFFLMLWSSWE